MKLTRSLNENWSAPVGFRWMADGPAASARETKAQRLKPANATGQSGTLLDKRGDAERGCLSGEDRGWRSSEVCSERARQGLMPPRTRVRHSQSPVQSHTTPPLARARKEHDLIRPTTLSPEHSRPAPAGDWGLCGTQRASVGLACLHADHPPRVQPSYTTHPSLFV